jgi:hypothetical protein
MAIFWVARQAGSLGRLGYFQNHLSAKKRKSGKEELLFFPCSLSLFTTPTTTPHHATRRTRSDWSGME